MAARKYRIKNNNLPAAALILHFNAAYGIMGVIQMALKSSEIEKLKRTPRRERVYRGFTYRDLERLGLEYSQYGRVRYNEIEEAYYRLFPKLEPLKSDATWLRLMVGYELQRWLIYANDEPPRLKARRVDLRRGIIPEAFRYGEGVDEDDAKEDKDEGVSMAVKKLTVKDIVTRAGGRRPRIFGFSVREVLLWLGANGYSFDEAARLLDRLKVEATYGTIKATVSNGRNNEGEKYGAPAELSRAQTKALKGLIPGKATKKKKAAPRRKDK